MPPQLVSRLEVEAAQVQPRGHERYGAIVSDRDVVDTVHRPGLISVRTEFEL